MRRVYWWANPTYVALLILLPICAMVALLPDSHFQGFGQRTKWFDGTVFLVGLCGILAFAAGCAAVSLAFPSPDQGLGQPVRSIWVEPRRYELAVVLIGLMVVLANLTILVPLVAKAGLLLQWLSGVRGSPGELRQALLTVPGLTSFTNLASLFAAMAALQYTLTGERPGRWTRRLIWLVVLSIVARALLKSERLAILEIAIPYAVVSFGVVRERWRARNALGPVAAGAMVIAMFAVTEYFRSWTFYRTVYASYWDFALSRLFGYYSTSLNNGAGLVTLFPPNLEGEQTLHWFYHFPLFEKLGVTTSESAFHEFAELFATEEFNNLSGLFSPIIDFGIIAGLLLWVVCGVLTGIIFEGYRRNRFFFVLLYPSWMIGVYEILRYFYWGQGRYFPALVGTIFVALVLMRYTRSRPAGQTQGPPRTTPMRPRFRLTGVRSAPAPAPAPRWQPPGRL